MAGDRRVDDGRRRAQADRFVTPALAVATGSGWLKTVTPAWETEDAQLLDGGRALESRRPGAGCALPLPHWRAWPPSWSCPSPAVREQHDVGARGVGELERLARGSRRAPRGRPLMTWLPGLRLLESASPSSARAPLPRSRAPRRARRRLEQGVRISASASSRSASVSRPRERRRPAMRSRRSESASNIERFRLPDAGPAAGAAGPAPEPCGPAGAQRRAQASSRASTNAWGEGDEVVGALPSPTSFTGIPSSRWMAITTPPLAVPSSLVSTHP